MYVVITSPLANKLWKYKGLTPALLIGKVVLRLSTSQTSETTNIQNVVVGLRV